MIDAFVEKLKSTLTTMGTDGVVLYLTTRYPFLGLPIVRVFTRLAVQKVITTLLDKTEFAAFAFYSERVTKEQANDFINEAKKNEEVQKNGTDAEKEAAKKALIDRARNLIKYTR